MKYKKKLQKYMQIYKEIPLCSAIQGFVLLNNKLDFLVKMKYATSPYDYRNLQRKGGFFSCPKLLLMGAVALHWSQLHQHHQKQINS